MVTIRGNDRERKVSIQSALELRSIEHNNKITYTSSNDERLLKVFSVFTHVTPTMATVVIRHLCAPQM